VYEHIDQIRMCIHWTRALYYVVITWSLR